MTPYDIQHRITDALAAGMPLELGPDELLMLREYLDALLMTNDRLWNALEYIDTTNAKLRTMETVEAMRANVLAAWCAVETN